MSQKNNHHSSCSYNQSNASKEARDEIMLKENMSKIKNKIVVLSGKGGVGKSTVATNLAVALAEKKFKTGLLDIDVHGPSVPKLLKLEGMMATGTGDKTILPVLYNEYLKVMSVGFLMQDKDQAVIWRGPLKYGVIKQFLTDVLWDDLDYLIVDSPPGTGDEPLSVCQLIENPKGAIIVTTPQDVALADVRKSITFCKQVNMPILGVIENMSGFLCPHCGHRTEIFKTGGGKLMSDDMGVPFLGAIPLEPRVVDSGDNGFPHLSALSSNATEAQKKFTEIVEKIINGGN